jgi:disulfide bond formation protein DsbB
MKRNTLYYASWFIALLGMMGSLYFSEVLHYPPCILCWYQRILLYPLVLIIPTGIILKDKNLPYYVLPLAIVGAMIGIYHNLLYYKVLPESIAPCSQGVSCTDEQINWLGFISIPLLALGAFVVLIGLMTIIIKRKNNE